MRVVRVDRFGEPDVLVVGKADEPEPGAGQVMVDVRVAGVVYGDVTVRSGRYPLPLPWVPGLDVGGVVTAVGPGMDESLCGKTVVAVGWPDQVRELTGGQGRIGLYGYASGGWPPLDIQAIARRGLTLCGPLGMVIRKPDAHRELEARRSVGAIILTVDHVG
jgi:Alcohol dehydrogenase GroES-like domain